MAQLLLRDLKAAGEDFEWYPTTDEMIAVVWRNARKIGSLLDIGAGDGRVLERFGEWSEHGVRKYAIEKSRIHIDNMPADISIVGTDFHAQSLIDKQVDCIFSNPPYAEYEEWVVKIIKEANADTVFLVIPERWSSRMVQEALASRDAVARVLWSGDFSTADRMSRAKVNIVKINLRDGSCGVQRHLKVDPFDAWFDEYFKGFTRAEPCQDEQEKPRLKDELVAGQNLIERLDKMYADELSTLLMNYKTLAELDADLLKELGVTVSAVRDGLRQKIEGLKNTYWKELFDHLNSITDRLTSKSRNSMLEKLHASCNVDFSIDNAYAVVMWAIKNANEYFDQQLMEMFKDLSEPECVKNYKSNERTWTKDRWRYKNEENYTHYTLEYRIISERWYAAQSEKGYSWDYENGLHKDAHAFVNDIFTIARNLGFYVIGDSRYRKWEGGQQQTFTCAGRNFLKVRAYKNGNLHMKFDQEFIKTFNIEASRLLGWIKTPQEAAEEMDVDLDFAVARFNSNLMLTAAQGRKMLTG